MPNVLFTSTRTTETFQRILCLLAAVGSNGCLPTSKGLECVYEISWFSKVRELAGQSLASENRHFNLKLSSSANEKKTIRES
jgi:hypothetical protein